MFPLPSKLLPRCTSSWKFLRSSSRRGGGVFPGSKGREKPGTRSRVELLTIIEVFRSLPPSHSTPLSPCDILARNSRALDIEMRLSRFGGKGGGGGKCIASLTHTRNKDREFDFVNGPHGRTYTRSAVTTRRPGVS